MVFYIVLFCKKNKYLALTFEAATLKAALQVYVAFGQSLVDIFLF